ncbi:hypothetical protein [Nocardia sp. NPDC046763]|uniref:hypothetical protein n=1 Tax=Nocardia sp. NPDC046763 TaxID=3155256 RepID=UPI0033DE547B
MSTVPAIASVVIAGAPEELLDTYETDRRPVALGVVAFTDRMTRMATLRTLPARLLRDAVLSSVTIAAVRQQLAFRLAELANR